MKEYEKIFNTICQKFDNKISTLDIISWLYNFDKEDWNKALNLLLHFEYYTLKKVITEFDNQLNIIKQTVPNERRIFLNSIGKIGKSGASMIYFAKKTNFFMNKNCQILDNSDFDKLNPDDLLILIDDFSGSGSTISNYYENIKALIPNEINVLALTVAFTSKAQNHLDKINIPIFGNIRFPIFQKRGSIFGYPPKALAMREFCFKYGDLLFSLKNYENKKTKLHPLGFENSQCLIGFEHSIPNNTLPIIWADKEYTKNSTKKFWQPIFPRYGDLKIDELKLIKKENAYWNSIVCKLKIGNDILNTDNKFSKNDLQIISLINLKSKKKNDLNICQVLGININEYEELIEKAKTLELINLDNNLTEKAVKIYSEILKSVKVKSKINTLEQIFIEEDFLYLPKWFQGSS
ncbi:hypothetical protein RRM46_002301 [Flavobacterium psychrophilum]|nr:hypothetical protein [Flavobacterium psychrophilum]